MNRAFQTWSPRTLPLKYDSLQQDVGCQNIAGTDAFSLKAFSRLCINEHAGGDIFDRLGTVSYATGPFQTGQLPPWATRWAAWVATAGVRVAKIPEVTPPANGTGYASTLYGDTKTSKVSIAFTAQGYYALAIQKTDEEIEIKWFDDGSGTNIGVKSFTGASPVLFQTALLQHSDDGVGNDLICFYVRPEKPGTIFARFKREGFATEYAINENLPAAPAQLIAAEAIDGKLVLYARDLFGRDLTLTGPLYGLVIDGDDSVDLSISVASGKYLTSAIKPSGTLTDEAILTISIDSGAYSDPIQEPSGNLSGDNTTLSIGIQSGEYE